MNKIIKFPNALISGDGTTVSLSLDNGTIIDQCIQVAGETGTFFLEQHLLYVVLGGKVILTYGKQKYVVNKNEMILLRKYSSVNYEKFGNRKTGLFESILFAIKDELIKDFLTTQNIKISKTNKEINVKASPMDAN